MITYDSSKCVKCNACIRVCPVHEANVHEIGPDGVSGININEKFCIKCGTCIKACDHGARGYEDDTERFIKDLKNGSRIVVIAAPAIKIAFDGYWRHVLYWMKAQGASHIFDVSFGADICTWAHLRYVRKNPGKKIISQPCAAIVNYVQKRAPQLIPYMSPVHSPMMCTAVYARKKLGNNIKIAVLSPCIAKKDEFNQTGLAEYNVTFKKLKEYFERENITFPKTRGKNYSEFEFDRFQGAMGSIYSRPGGLKDNLKLYASSLDVINCEGPDLIYKTLDRYAFVSSYSLPVVFDVLSCGHGCNGGPAVGQNYDLFQMEHIMHDVDNYIKKKFRTKLFGKNFLFVRFDRELNVKDFCRGYVSENMPSVKVTSAQIDKAMLTLGKRTEEERNYNCHACGYGSCREMAEAMSKGINVKESCMQYVIHMAGESAARTSSMLEEFKSLSSDLNGVIGELRENISAVKLNSQKIDDIGKTSSSDMESLNGNINMLDEQAEGALKAMDMINQSIDGYKEMTKTVTDIAKQINLLAVNAGIEAVRAGAAGKGFSVIAAEIRSLAAKSQQSVGEADKCNENINLSVKNIRKTIDTLNETAAALNAAIDKIGGDVGETMERGADINSLMGNVGGVTDRISTLVERSNQLAENIQAV